MKRVLGLDPSTTGAHAVVLDVDEGALVTVAGGFSFVDAFDTVDSALGLLAYRFDLVVIERPAGFVYAAARAAALIDTAYQAGRFACMAQKMVPADAVVELPAQAWRAALLGRPRVRGQFAGTAGDAAVKNAVLALVKDWPKTSNAHARDAAGVAIVGARRHFLAQRRTGT